MSLSDFHAYHLNNPAINNDYRGIFHNRHYRKTKIKKKKVEVIKDILKITREEQVCPRERAGNCCVQGNRRSLALMRACVVSPGGCFWTSACPSLGFPLFVPLAFMRFLLILSLIQHLSILWFSLNFIFCLFLYTYHSLFFSLLSPCLFSFFHSSKAILSSLTICPHTSIFIHVHTQYICFYIPSKNIALLLNFSSAFSGRCLCNLGNH